MRAGAKVLQAKTLALQECAGGAHQYLQHTTSGMLMMLLACSQQAEILDPSDSTRNQVAALRGQGLLPTMFVPPPAPAVVGDAAASGSGDGDSPKKSKNKTASKNFYDDPADAEWRMDKESWVKRRTDRRRRVHVNLGQKLGWQDYSERVTGILLEFYDRAKPLDQLDGVSVDTPEGNLYLDFRFEGGAYMTQTNPNRTGIRREVKVYHAEGI